jgi:hypothetical protein
MHIREDVEPDLIAHAAWSLDTALTRNGPRHAQGWFRDADRMAAGLHAVAESCDSREFPAPALDVQPVVAGRERVSPVRRPNQGSVT